MLVINHETPQRNKNQMKVDHRVNGQIRIPEVQVIDHNGNNLGRMDIRDAKELAEKAGLDLVEVAPQSRPPVCRIIDYGKYKYEQSKAAKRQKSLEPKTIQIKPNTDDADLQRKALQGNKFLEEGHPLNVALRMRGREQAHIDIWFEKIGDFAKLLSSGTPGSPSRNGRTITMSVQPKSQDKQ